MFKSYIDPVENAEAKKALPRLMVEGLVAGGGGLGVLALIFEIAADAFSVAAYQTLLAIHGANGRHDIAIYAFIVLSVMLFLGIVPAYKAGAYLRPNAGGSGPLVEAIGPPKMRWLSWIGSSLFFIDAILTIIISSISAADATMLILPEFAAYRILLAEIFAFFIMAVLVILGPKRAVPLFLIGGGAFTLFTIGALALVGITAAFNPEWAFLSEGITARLQSDHVVTEVVRFVGERPGFAFTLFLKSMSSAMLGFSGYEVIPASGKHAAKPKWKVINTALTLAAVFLIGTGVIQLFAAQAWNIPATEGYSTLLIEYEIAATQIFGNGVDEADVVVTDADYEKAEAILEEASHHEGELHGTGPLSLDETAFNVAAGNALVEANEGTFGAVFLLAAGVLLAIILLLAQGGGYVGGAAVAANAARLGRLPAMFADDRIGIAVIWAIAAILIPIIREVLIVESYYAFGFVSAFVITSTTVFFVRDDVLLSRNIQPGSAEAKSLKFAGLRGMIASYLMAIVLITQKTDALFAITVAGVLITLIQIFVANGKIGKRKAQPAAPNYAAGTTKLAHTNGVDRAYTAAYQRGLAHAVSELIDAGTTAKFNVENPRIKRMMTHLHSLDPHLLMPHESGHSHDDEHDHIEEPSVELEEAYHLAYGRKPELLRQIESYSHFGIFMFVHNYHKNWVSPQHGRDEDMVQQAMLDILFANTPHQEIWHEYQTWQPDRLHEHVWQFSQKRYEWAKDQWPNLSDRITTIWTLQDFGLIKDDVDIDTIVAVAGGREHRRITVSSDGQIKGKEKIE